AGPPSRSRRGAGRGAPGYFTAKQVKELAPRTDSFRPSPGVHFLQSPGAPRTRRRFRGEQSVGPSLTGQRDVCPHPRYFTAKQVIVLKTPSIFWILSTISEPIELTSGASHTAITSYSPVMASAAEMPLTPSIFLATSRARPGDALIRT